METAARKSSLPVVLAPRQAQAAASVLARYRAGRSTTGSAPAACPCIPAAGSTVKTASLFPRTASPIWT